MSGQVRSNSLDSRILYLGSNKHNVSKVNGDSVSSICEVQERSFLHLFFHYFTICQFSKAVLFTNTALGLKLLSAYGEWLGGHVSFAGLLFQQPSHSSCSGFVLV